jgi:class 3 adenylate cyclase
MALSDEINTYIKNTFSDAWETTNGLVVPTPADISSGNIGKVIDAVVLYADINGSTAMVKKYPPTFSANIYKTYLYSAGRILRKQGGTITAYDGDRIMAVFVGKTKRTDAVRSALEINYVVRCINNNTHVKENNFKLKHVIGIDQSELLVSKIGIRGDNDLVWVGRAANYAAKLTDESEKTSIRITDDVYSRMMDSVKYKSDMDNSVNMWNLEPEKFKELKIWGSNYGWKL